MHRNIERVIQGIINQAQLKTMLNEQFKKYDRLIKIKIHKKGIICTAENAQSLLQVKSVVYYCSRFVSRLVKRP